VKIENSQQFPLFKLDRDIIIDRLKMCSLNLFVKPGMRNISLNPLMACGFLVNYNKELSRLHYNNLMHKDLLQRYGGLNKTLLQRVQFGKYSQKIALLLLLWLCLGETLLEFYKRRNIIFIFVVFT